ATIYCYDAHLEDHQVFTAGRMKLGLGRVQLSSKITRESQKLNFGVLHLGDHNINGGVAEYRDDETYRSIVESVVQPFRRADLTGVIRVMGRRFGESNYSLRSLFRDQQRSLVNTILAANLTEAESLYRRIYDHSAPIMRFLTDLAIPLPKGFSAAAEFVLNHALTTALQQPTIDRKLVTRLFETAKEEGVSLDMTPLEFAYRRSLESAATALEAQPSLSMLEQFLEAVNLLEQLPFKANLWKVQNIFYELAHREYPSQRDARRLGDDTASRWITCFEDLGLILGVKVSELSN
ncbi:MAG TPA: DUF3536 domain-containing protein, partial [Candidatus Binatia bacterium]